ncbi:potassium channel family protein [Jeotgalibacillus campisalis]|uniref:Metal transporter n=1 Tax=Jeotgalibacillus campisalis TaxID=220754 RepID=A0A0C2SAH7_9BACL|nr:potassium channel family protein [Jeotgalibacillus campisalis]KIL50954.1 metal transporter [Jeotgalibacillus campisalis]
MASTLLIGITIVYLLITLYYFFTNKSFTHSYFSPVLFYKLFFVLLSLTVGFGLLYYLLSINEQILSINDPNGDPVERTFANYLYFSGVTILAVGYGDMVPVGAARFFSLIQASLGLLLPTAYFMKALSSSKDEEDKS